jgi:hypothetical protein
MHLSIFFTGGSYVKGRYGRGTEPDAPMKSPDFVDFRRFTASLNFLAKDSFHRLSPSRGGSWSNTLRNQTEDCSQMCDTEGKHFRQC